MNLEIRHLRLVAAIAETGSVTRAGNHLHLTQSALSHQLRDAEEQLGTSLFQRKSAKMMLTPAGERLLQAARTVLGELERAEMEIQKNETAPKGLIRLSTQCHTVYHWLPPRLSFFQRQFPEVEVQLVIEATNNPFAALLEGKLDLAIVNEPIRNRKIRYMPLFEDESLIAVPPEHWLASKSYAAPENFATETILLYPPKEDSTLLMKILQPAGNSSEENSGSDADRGDHRNGDRRTGDCRAAEMDGCPSTRFGRFDWGAFEAAGMPLDVVYRTVAR